MDVSKLGLNTRIGLAFVLVVGLWMEGLGALLLAAFGVLLYGISPGVPPALICWGCSAVVGVVFLHHTAAMLKRLLHD